MLRIEQARMPDRAPDVRELFAEYLQWGNTMLQQEYGFTLNIEAMLEHDTTDLDKYAPPGGCLLLAELDGIVVGCACMRPMGPGLGELKRMYVRPGQRRHGIGRTLLDAVLDRASQAGYSRIRLDSVRFMREAHALYKSSGFKEIEPYEGSEIPEHYRPHWVFMEKALSPVSE